MFFFFLFDVPYILQSHSKYSGVHSILWQGIENTISALQFFMMPFKNPKPSPFNPSNFIGIFFEGFIINFMYMNFIYALKLVDFFNPFCCLQQRKN